MKQTLNQLIDHVEYFADNHNQINTFSYGELSTLSNQSDTEVIYPLLHMQVDDSVIDENFVYLTCNLICMDLVQKDDTNIKDVQSDTLQILNDLRSWLGDNYNMHKLGINVEKSANVIPFVDRFSDEVTGWNLILKVKIKNTKGICNIPFYSPAAYDCADFNPSITLSNDAICAGHGNTITINNPEAGVTYQWILLTEVVNTGTEYITTGVPDEAGDYTILATNSYNCTGSTGTTLYYVPYPELTVVSSTPDSGSQDGQIIFDFTDPTVYSYNYQIQIASENGQIAITQENDTTFNGLINDRYTIKAFVQTPTGNYSCQYDTEYVLS